MAAVVITPTGARPQRPPVPVRRPGVRRVAPGAPSAATGRLAPSVYWRRRVLALAGALVALTGVVLVAQLAVSSIVAWRVGPVTGPPHPSSAPAATAGAPGADYVVMPGDSLWSIAQRIAPDADPRPIVDELARRAGGPSIRPGQRLSLDGIA